MANRQHEEAERAIQRALAALPEGNPDRHGCLGVLVLVLMNWERYEMALPQALECVRLGEIKFGRAEAIDLVPLAHCYRELGMRGEARSTFERLLRENPDIGEEATEEFKRQLQRLSEHE